MGSACRHASGSCHSIHQNQYFKSLNLSAKRPISRPSDAPQIKMSGDHDRISRRRFVRSRRIQPGSRQQSKIAGAPHSDTVQRAFRSPRQPCRSCERSIDRASGGSVPEMRRERSRFVGVLTRTKINSRRRRGVFCDMPRRQWMLIFSGERDASHSLRLSSEQWLKSLRWTLQSHGSRTIGRQGKRVVSRSMRVQPHAKTRASRLSPETAPLPLLTTTPDVKQGELKAIPENARLLPPCSPTKIVCVGRNYVDHAKESGNPVPAEPLIFLKPMFVPDRSRRVHRLSGHLAERKLRGRTGAHHRQTRARHIARENAFDYIAGYTCLNDVTARDIQRKDVQFTRGKGFDTFCAVGPHMAPRSGRRFRRNCASSLVWTVR